MPPEYCLARRPAASLRSNQASSSLGADPRLRGRQVEQLPDHHQVLGAGQILVDRGVLAGEPDGAADQVRLTQHVVTGDPGRTFVGPQQGGQDAYGSGLARAVGAEDTEHGALLGGEVHAGQGLGATETLLQPGSFDDVHGPRVRALADTARTRR
jgi:hypothetical protein